MLGSDELELLSRLEAGELDAEQTAWLEARLAKEPELARALKRLQRLDEAVLGLKLEATDDVDAVERALRKLEPQRSSRLWLALAAGVLVAVGIGIGFAQREEVVRPIAEERTEPAVPREVVAMVADASAPSKVATPPGEFAPRTMTAGATPMRIEREGHEVWLAPFSHVRLEDERTVRVESGAAVLDGIGRLMLDGLVLTVDGLAAGCSEPKDCLTRVVVLLANTHRRAAPQALESLELKSSKWRAPVAMVLSGSAQADKPGVVAMALAVGDDVQGTMEEKRARLANAKSAGISMVDLHRAVMSRGAKLIQCAPKEPSGGKFEAVVAIDERGRAASLTRVSRLADGLHTTCFRLFDGLVLERKPGAEAVELKFEFEIQPRGDDAGGWMLVMPVDGADQLTFMANREGLVDVNVGDSPSEGPANAKVTVVLFTELECPFCLKSHDTWKRLRTTYAGRVRFVFKHRPMNFHPQGILGAKAMAAAQLQGRFWEFSDRAFELKASTTDQLRNIALGLSLDMARYENDLASTWAKVTVDVDADEAQRLGVRGVPSWFINGEEVVGAQPFEKLAEKIDAALLRARR